MKRIIIPLLLCMCSPVGANPQSAATRMRKPNIILILSDDQGYGDVGRHGNPILKTPNLDRLHDESPRFTDFHVSPTCAPTRSALLSGRHEFKNGVSHTILERERMSLKTTTLAEVLKTAGYTTGIFGKWHLGDEPARWPSRRGFDEMFIHGCGGIGQTYPGTCGDAPGNQYFDPVINHNGAFEKTRGYCTDVFFQQASQWINAAKGRKPFFAMITPNAPHAPLVVAERYEKMYADKLPRDKAGKDAAKFFGMIANIDENVGKLLAQLKEQGIERETLLIYMNDNGGTAGVHVWNAGMRARKNTPYLGGTRAISFWRWPGTLTPATIDRLTAHIDIFPTLAELAGAKLSAAVKAQVEGRSLAPLLRNPRADWPDRHLFTHIGRWAKGANPNDSKYAQCSVRSTRWHLVNSSREGAKNWELYDVQADPGEKTDLAARHPDVVKEMDAAYDKWWAEVLPLLENENATPPAVNPYHELYWKQYRGPGPNNAPPGTSRVQSQPARRPNVLFLFSDDQRADTIRALGNDHITTPNLDRLAGEGTAFTRAYCMGAQQGAVCVPSRAMLMSGQTLFRISEKLEGQTTWPQVFARNGYATFGIGKWHNQPPSFINTFAEGKAVFFGGMNDPYTMPVQDLSADRKLVNKRISETHATALFADAAIEFLNKQKGERPFVLYAAFTLPHDPRTAPKEYRAMYDAAKLPLPINFLPRHPFDNGELLVRDEKLAPWPRTPEIVREHLADYYACISYLDAWIGRILEALKQSGQYDNTIIVFASDSGLAIGSHGLFGKQNIYEHSMRAPLVIAGPGVPKGRRTDAFSYLLDLFPTLCDLAGLKTPAEVEGLSLAPVLAGKLKTRRDAIFTAYRQVQRAVRDDRWKLIVYPRINKTQLFDLKADPAETRDLANDLKFAARIERMTALLKKKQAEAGDTQPLRVDNPAPVAFDFTKQSGR